MQPNQPYQQYAYPPGMPPQNTNNMQPQSAPKGHPWGLIIGLVIFVLLTLVAASFGIWAFAERQNYKDNSDKISAKAVAVEIQKEDTKKDNEFLEREKSPLKTYVGPDTYGSISLSYPKTWAAYVVQTDAGQIPIDGYLHPGFVPGVQSGTAFALRVQVVNRPYDLELKQFEGKVKSGKVTVAAYVPKNVSGVTGSRINGEINMGQKDAMVLLPVRDKTIEISTQSQQFLGDFENIILANLKFVP